jgi:hypothetical protein
MTSALKSESLNTKFRLNIEDKNVTLFTTIYGAEPGDRSDLCQRLGLIHIGNAHLMFLPSRDALFKSRIVKSPMKITHSVQRNTLLLCGIELICDPTCFHNKYIGSLFKYAKRTNINIGVGLHLPPNGIPSILEGVLADL